jgi:ABC-2 type transport system ATP-binding protein
MAQRLLIARALIHRPQVLFLDEPSTGLDPQARLFVWEQVRELRDSGVTVVITTHDMDEAAELTDRVGIMDHGRLLALDTPAALTRGLPGGSTLELVVTCPQDETPEQVLDALGTLAGVEQVEQVGSPPDPEHPGEQLRVRLYLEGEGAAHIAPVAELLARRGARLGSVVLGEPTLEDVFLGLTGRDLR